jgi:hypothetical protein
MLRVRRRILEILKKQARLVGNNATGAGAARRYGRQLLHRVWRPAAGWRQVLRGLWHFPGPLMLQKADQVHP